MTERDAQLRALLRIKKARESKAHRVLKAATDNETRRQLIRDNARDYRDTCAENATGYVRKRFEQRDSTEDFGFFFESVMTGHMTAKRTLARADLTYQRVEQRYSAATAERKAATRDLLSKMRRVEALETLLADRQGHQNTLQEITDDDDLSEIARTSDAAR